MCSELLRIYFSLFSVCFGFALGCIRFSFRLCLGFIDLICVLFRVRFEFAHSCFRVYCIFGYLVLISGWFRFCLGLIQGLVILVFLLLAVD